MCENLAFRMCKYRLDSSYTSRKKIVFAICNKQRWLNFKIRQTRLETVDRDLRQLSSVSISFFSENTKKDPKSESQKEKKTYLNASIESRWEYNLENSQSYRFPLTNFFNVIANRTSHNRQHNR